MLVISLSESSHAQMWNLASEDEALKVEHLPQAQH